MRVTKIVREYIEEQVEKKYPLPQKPEDVYSKMTDEIHDAIVPIAVDIISRYTDRVEFYANWNYEKILSAEDFAKNISFSFKGYTKAKDLEEYKQNCREIKTKREKAVKDIIVTLELGGTKKDLEEMLANLPE